MSLPSFAVRQVVLVNLLFVVLMLTGVMVARRIPVDGFPDISFNTAVVITAWTGASPDEMERLVTHKLEDEIDGIPGIKEMFSFSTHGLSEINIIESNGCRFGAGQIQHVQRSIEPSHAETVSSVK